MDASYKHKNSASKVTAYRHVLTETYTYVRMYVIITNACLTV